MATIHVETKQWQINEHYICDSPVLSICDLGVGIKHTLPIQNKEKITWLNRIISKFGANATKDSSHIKAAIELGATRTKKDNRGNGLAEMIQVVKESNNGALRIYSDAGFFSYSKKYDKEYLIDFGDSIMGTLIQWSFEADQA